MSFQWTAWQGVMNIGRWSEKIYGELCPLFPGKENKAKHRPYGVNNYLTIKNKNVLYQCQEKLWIIVHYALSVRVKVDLQSFDVLNIRISEFNLFIL